MSHPSRANACMDHLCFPLRAPPYAPAYPTPTGASRLGAAPHNDGAPPALLDFHHQAAHARQLKPSSCNETVAPASEAAPSRCWLESRLQIHQFPRRLRYYQRPPSECWSCRSWIRHSSVCPRWLDCTTALSTSRLACCVMSGEHWRVVLGGAGHAMLQVDSASLAIICLRDAAAAGV